MGQESRKLAQSIDGGMARVFGLIGDYVEGMTTNEIPVRMDFDAHAPRFGKALNTLDAASRAGDLDKALAELVRVHASQINGCAYCVDMHTKDARAAGETEQRLYALPVWRETPYYTEAERAALALTEAITRLPDNQVPDDVYQSAAKHFDEPQLAQLISVIVMVNAWNRVAVTTHAWVPGSYQP
jgi:AhpD family alkylhydroperoxidase